MKRRIRKFVSKARPRRHLTGWQTYLEQFIRKEKFIEVDKLGDSSKKIHRRHKSQDSNVPPIERMLTQAHAFDEYQKTVLPESDEEYQ